jgi:hypothetical protein
LAGIRGGHAVIPEHPHLLSRASLALVLRVEDAEVVEEAIQRSWNADASFGLRAAQARFERFRVGGMKLQAHRDDIGCVAIEVEHGYISLSGTVRRRYQSAIAEQSMYCLLGVRGITNDIDIESPISRGSSATASQRSLPDGTQSTRSSFLEILDLHQTSKAVCRQY